MTYSIRVWLIVGLSFCIQSLQAIEWTSKDLDTFTCENELVDARFSTDALYSHDNALLLLWAANRVESGEVNQLKERFKKFGFRRVNEIYSDIRGARGVIASNSDTVLIVYRGTIRTGEIIRNALFMQKNSELESIEGRIHYGMHQHFAEILPELKKQLWWHDAFKRKKVIISGHSLGAAMATLSASVADSLGYSVHAVYASAPPRIGDRKFSDDIQKRLGERIHAVALRKDIVPQIPPTKGNALAFSDLISGENIVKESLFNLVETLNYTFNPGNLNIVTKQDGVLETDLSSLEDVERNFLQQIRSQFDSESFLDLISDLSTRFSDHEPTKYACKLSEALKNR